jgi:hypothetical protein
MGVLRGKTILQVTLAAVVIWTAVLAGLLAWNINVELKQTSDQARHQTRTFFQEFLMTRFWNAMHGGVYVPITENTQPNIYLDDRYRDVATVEGIKLTKLNPSYMTRQIAEIAAKKGGFYFHISSPDPLRPENKPDPWEAKAFESFAAGKQELFETVEEKGKQFFKFMGPLYFEQACLECHDDAKLGQLSGGISITMPADPLLMSQRNNITSLSGAYFLIWTLGIFGMCAAHNRLRLEESKREKAILQLEDALGEVKQLSGLLPICSSCKNIRDDKGYWQQLERYIGEHSEAQFSHSICPDCAKELYPELYERIQKKKAAEKNKA